MIEAPTRFNRQRSHQTGSRSELIRRLETSTSARSWIIRGVAPIALPPRHLQHNDRKKEKKFCQSFCVILLFMYSQGKPGEKIRREQISMVQEYIEIRGARENNLKDVSLRLPKRNITIFTGVSGSGKSSVVFDTIANEAQRLLYEGDFTGLLQADTLTGNHLLRKRPLKESFRQATGALPIVHATVNNLQDVSVNIPTGVLTVITGVAGSGKTR